MLNKELIEKLDMTNPAVWLATWFGCGLIKGAPGTWGTLGGLPFGVLFLYLGGWPLLLVAVLVVSVLGYIVTAKYEELTGEHDASAIVIDEVAGIWLALIVVPMTFLAVVLAFFVFRFFDVLKPWPICWLDRLPGAGGVMGDDLMAGIFTALTIGGLHLANII